MKEPILALIYDFDNTLASTDMQNFSFIPSLNLTPGEFWEKTNQLFKVENMDKVLCYLLVMIEECKKRNIKLTKEFLESCGKDISYFEGVKTWFERINKYGKEHNVKIEHYIISCGNKEIVDGCSIAKNFTKIFACEFLYDEKGEAIWPKVAINYTGKTQYIYRIKKGITDDNDDIEINEKMEDKRVRMDNMIYIGDGMTDIPCMQVLKDKGGKAIAVYRPNDEEKVMKLVSDSRINFVCQADYSQNSSLEKFVQMSIENMVLYEKLRQKEEKQLANYRHKYDGDLDV